MRAKTSDARVLAIDPTSRGFGYAVLEGPTRLVDWGVTETTRADNRWVVAHVTAKIRHFAPDRLVLEDVGTRGARRRSRVRRLLDDLHELAKEMRLGVAVVSKSKVNQMFASAGATNKEQVADILIGHFPELRAWRPPVRKTWMSEDARMAIFDAVAFALTHFYFEEENESRAA